ANREMLERVGWGVRSADDLEWLTRLGRGDTHAWEVVIGRSGVLEVELGLGPEATATVAAPVLPGHHVQVVFRPRLGESGLVSHRRVPAGKSFPVGWTSWGVTSERWGACLCVLTPGKDTERITITAVGN